MVTLRREDERATLRQEVAKMDTLRREDERWIPFAEIQRLYVNHIHEDDVTSSLIENGVKKVFLDCLV